MVRARLRTAVLVLAVAVASGGFFFCGVASVPATDEPAASVSQATRADAQSLYRDGERAFAEGLPQVALYKLGAALAADPPPALRRAAALTAVRAMIATADPAAALALLDKEFPPAVGEGSDELLARFWRAQALGALGRWEEALAAYTQAGQSISATPTAPAGLAPEASFGRAEALLALNRPAEALAVCKALADDPRLGERARLRGAEIALDTLQLKDAAALLLRPEPPAPPEDKAGARWLLKERTFLIGRVRLAQKQTALAEQIFSAAAAHPNGLSERLLACNFWGWTEALLEEGKLGQAEDALESFVGNYPQTTYLGATLAWLEQLYARDPLLPNLADLRGWAADSTQPRRQAPALLMLAHVEETLGRPDRAEALYQTFADAFPDHPLRIRAALDLAALRLRGNHLPEAHQALDHARALAAAGATQTAPPREPADAQNEIDMLDARLSLSENNSAHAAALFEAIANRPGLTQAQSEAAAFNAVLGWLRASETDRFAATERTFMERFPRSPFGAELSLEEGLARAARTPEEDRNGRQRAAAALRHFLRDNRAHPRASEARIALGELAFERPRPNLLAAWCELAAPELRLIDNPGGPAGGAPDLKPVLAQGGPNSEGSPTADGGAAGGPSSENDRAVYLAIWLADTPGPTQDSRQAIALATRFLERRPESPLAPEVRMKLCEIYFRNEDYSAAETQLELLAEKTPDSPLVESALYLAGLAASRSMSNTGLENAVVLFQKAMQRNGPFKLAARLRQAELQKRLGNLPDARTLYKEVLAATDNAAAALSDADLEARCTALAGLGETLFLLGAADAKLYGEAADAFDQLANRTARASLPWRRQALTQKGQALEKIGDATAALAAYDDALNAADPPDSNSREAEWTWFYRAGSDAARLLESQLQWQSAIAIYKKLAAADGPLKADYENKLSRSRLEHFIWPD